MGRVDGKVALITGGASGIGLAAARLFLDEGAKLVLTDRDKSAAEAALAALGNGASFHLLDVTREDDWIAVTDAVVAEFGRLDVLVNSAGVALLRDIETTTLDEWRALMAVNLDGTFLGCKHAVRVMKERGGGSIVNMSSVAGLIGSGNLAAYSASKGGVRLLTKSVALHCARKGYNIRCNSVHPSFVETPMLRAMIAAARDPAKMEANYARAAPLGRLAQPIDVARTILFLASDESAFTTGAELVVDGGLTAA
ncbi:MAG TPA: glucose 1-dehydrogenase [Xanthobacteraceae bacterium]|nr:glucose 1-dehydrogenase [Xanthobacteraceae bacterium]